MGAFDLTDVGAGGAVLPTPPRMPPMTPPIWPPGTPPGTPPSTPNALASGSGASLSMATSFGTKEGASNLPLSKNTWRGATAAFTTDGAGGGAGGGGGPTSMVCVYDFKSSVFVNQSERNIGVPSTTTCRTTAINTSTKRRGRFIWLASSSDCDKSNWAT